MNSSAGQLDACRGGSLLLASLADLLFMCAKPCLAGWSRQLFASGSGRALQRFSRLFAALLLGTSWFLMCAAGLPATESRHPLTAVACSLGSSIVPALGRHSFIGSGGLLAASTSLFLPTVQQGFRFCLHQLSLWLSFCYQSVLLSNCEVAEDDWKSGKPCCRRLGLPPSYSGAARQGTTITGQFRSEGCRPTHQ